MNKFKWTLASCLVVISAAAQEYKQSLESVAWVKIESKGKVVIKTHDKPELLIRGGSALTTPEKAKGLQLVGENGSDNTKVGFYVLKDGNSLIVRNLRRSENETAEIFLPSTQNISVTGDGLNDIEINGFSGEIEATAEIVGNIRVVDVTGPVTLNSNTGTVEVVFNKVNQKSPISISTATGEIDVTLPKDTAADLSLHSTMGEIYSNFELSVPDKNGLKAISTQKIVGSINNGGVKIQLNSATGNIYLRKN